MRENLESLVTKLRSVGAAGVKGLRPGLSEKQVVASLKGEGLATGAQVLGWYQWCNGSVGAGTFGQSRIFGNFWPITLEEAIKAKREVGIFDRLQGQMLPIAEDGCGDYLAIDCSLDEGPVLRDSKDENPRVTYDGIATMAATLSEGIDRGAVTVEADGSLDFDADAWRTICDALNPRAR